MKVTILVIFRLQFTPTLLCGHHPYSEQFYPCKTKTLWLFNTNSPLLSTPGNHHCVICLCRLDDSRYLRWVEILPYLSLCAWLISFSTSSRFIHVVASVRIPFLQLIKIPLWIQTALCTPIHRAVDAGLRLPLCSCEQCCCELGCRTLSSSSCFEFLGACVW